MTTRICRTIFVSVLLLTVAQTAVAQDDWDAVEMTVHSVAGNVSYIEGRGGK
jgi:hypothetical protein